MNKNKYSIKLQDINVLIILFLLTCLILTTTKCVKYKSNYLSLVSLNVSIKDTVLVKEYNTYTKDTVTYKTSAQIDETVFNNLIKENAVLKKRLKKFKEIQSVTEETTVTNIKSEKFTFDTPITKDFKPIVIDTTTLNYKLTATITNTDLTIDTLSIPDSVLIVVGQKRGNIFKPDNYVVSIEHSNPLIVTQGLKNYTIGYNTKWYKKPGVHFVAGLTSMFIITKLIK
jgi:hypothetical protein